MLLDEQPGLDFNYSDEWMNPEPEMPLIGPGGCFPGGQEWGTGWEGASGEVGGGGSLLDSIWDFGGDMDLANMGIGQAWELGSGLF